MWNTLVLSTLGITEPIFNAYDVYRAQRPICWPLKVPKGLIKHSSVHQGISAYTTLAILAAARQMLVSTITCISRSFTASLFLRPGPTTVLWRAFCYHLRILWASFRWSFGNAICNWERTALQNRPNTLFCFFAPPSRCASLVEVGYRNHACTTWYAHQWHH